MKGRPKTAVQQRAEADGAERDGAPQPSAVLGGPTGRMMRIDSDTVSRIGARLARATRRGRARTFGRRQFPTCEVHAHETGAVYSLAEAFTGGPVHNLDLDGSFGDAFGDPGVVALRGLNMAEVVAVVAAIEREYGAGREDTQVPPMDRAAEVLGRVLLGQAATGSDWDARTVWRRSIRSLVNERARCRGGCTCGSEAGRPARG
jgi:hypothetical protein